MGGPTFFISAGEPSGDLHAANLIASVRRQAPGACFFGLGGPRMAAQGCELLRDMTVHGSHMLVVRPVLELGKYLALVGEVDRRLQDTRPEVMIFVDYPGLNFVLASRGRVRRIPTMWYIPPQLWAWASFRVKKMARRLTRVACVFPFTVDFYRSHGIDARFVGHPLVDHFSTLQLDNAVIGRVKSVGSGRTVLLLPGSRASEIRQLLPLYLRVARLMRRQRPDLRFVAGCLNEEHARWTRSILKAARDLPVDVYAGKTNDLMSVADLALAGSGTATLELAMFGTPMIALYPVNRFEYQLLGRWLITTPFLSLPNAVAQRSIVPEFYLHWDGPGPIVREALDILSNERRNRRMRDDLAGVREKLGGPGASDRAAQAALDLVGRPVPPSPWWRSGLNP